MSPRKARQVCPIPSCPVLTDGGRCDDHKRQADQQRGSAAQRGYGGKTWANSRNAVLRRDPVCVCEDQGHGHDGRACGKPSTVADHYPHERKDLLAAGVPDPDAPHRMRGVCGGCHAKKTGATRPGGWNAR